LKKPSLTDWVFLFLVTENSKSFLYLGEEIPTVA